MKWIYLFPLLLCLSFACSKNEDLPDVNPVKKKITGIEPLRARIGDTIIVYGNGMERTVLKINERLLSFIARDAEKITFILPVVYNEHTVINAYVDNRNVDSIALNIFGVFPLSLGEQFFFTEIGAVKMISQETAFLAAGSELYKTVDGGYNWELVKDFSSDIGLRFFFLDEKHGWVSVSKYNKTTVYYTTDGGMSFNPIFEEVFFYKAINHIFFTSPKEGYLLTTKGEIYITTDNSNFELIYDFPNSDEKNGRMEFSAFSVFEDNLIISGSDKNYTPTLIIKKADRIEYLHFKNELSHVQLTDKEEAFMLQGKKLYKSEGLNEDWKLLSDKRIYNFYFLNKDLGIGISSNPSREYHTIFETCDGGKSWVNEFELRDFQYTKDLDFYGKVGLIIGYRGHIWKYIAE